MFKKILYVVCAFGLVGCDRAGVPASESPVEPAARGPAGRMPPAPEVEAPRGVGPVRDVLRADPSRPAPLDKVALPPGFEIGFFAADVPGARSLVRSEATGVVYVGSRGAGKVYALVDGDGDGSAERTVVVAQGLDTPNGVAWHGGDLYVALHDRVIKYEGLDGRLEDPPPPQVIFDGYPKDRSHGWKFAAFGPDGKLYVPVGAPCNVCEREDPMYASITRMNRDGSGFEIVASGVRNSVGFTWHPETKEMWLTDNGRDQMGNDIPGDELNRMAQVGGHFGFPYCHAGTIVDPKFGRPQGCEGFVPPAQVLGPHVASLGVRFYTGGGWPERYRGQAFIAEHGSWNRDDPIGYRVTRVPLDASGTKALGYEVFASGWLGEDGERRGRPVDLLVMPDGSMLVSDDHKGAVYRIWYKGDR